MLGGKYFELAVNDGQQVKKGDLLLTCDLDKIREAGYQTITPIIVTNTNAYSKVSMMYLGEIEPRADLIEVE